MKLVITALCLLFLSIAALTQAYKAAGYRQAYERSQESLEAMARTRGVVDAAYRCVKK